MQITNNNKAKIYLTKRPRSKLYYIQDLYHNNNVEYNLVTDAGLSLQNLEASKEEIRINEIYLKRSLKET